MVRFAILLATLAGFPAVAHAQSSVQTAPDPWSLTFAQRGGASLRTAERSLGFESITGWVQATRLVSMRGGTAVVATDDAAGRQIEVSVRASGGVTAFHAKVIGGPTGDVRAMRIGFAAPRSERMYGLGERSISVDQRGQDVDQYVSDGPFVKDTRPFVSATIPPQGFRDRDDATYYPVPWMLSSRGYGLLLDDDEPSVFHLATNPDDQWSVEVAAQHLDFRVFAGPKPAGALRRFTAATGRQPPPTTPWQFGPWFQTGQPNIVPLADEASWLDKLQKADAPVSVAETQLRYLPCGLDRGNEDYESKRVEHFHSRGLAILTYVNPMVCASYQPLFSDAAAAGALQRDATGRPYTFNSFVGGTGPAGFTVQPVASFDFSSPAGSTVYSTVLKRIIDAGHDGWMEDFGEYTPTDTQPRDGTPPAAMHNRFPATYHCAVAQVIAGGLSPRPVVRFQRSGWTGAARCASDVWGGDPTTSFGFDGLSSAVKQALTIGMSGVSRWGSDIGGYDTLGNDPQLTPELLKRWIEFGAVSGVMRTKSTGLTLPSYTRPQIWEPGLVGVWRRYAKLHTQLYPYILAADSAYRSSGMPLMRALVLSYPGDRRAGAAEDEFGFGPDLLAAPVVKAGVNKRRVYLPRGRWIDWNRSIRYRKADGSFHIRRARVARGRQTVTAPAALDQLPLYLRDGTILPLLAPDVDTLSPYRARGVVRFADRAGRLRLLAFPRGRSTGRAFEGDRFVSRVRRGRWTLRIRASRARRYSLEATTAALGRVCSVSVGGRTLRHSAWRVRGRVLSVRFRAGRHATLVARRCRA